MRPSWNEKRRAFASSRWLKDEPLADACPFSSSRTSRSYKEARSRELQA